MTAFPVPLDALIAHVHTLHPEGGPLDRLADAVVAASQLDDQADALIGYFVDQARRSGATWSQIGAAMGVSKQAAQKRFVAKDDELTPEGKTFSRFTPRARASIAAAGQLARTAGADSIDAVHVAAGLLVDPDGLAARAVHRLDLADDQVYRALGVGPASDEADPDPTALRELKFTPAARDALKEALKAALRLSHNYIGTEHLLLGVTAGRNAAASNLAAIGLERTLIESALGVEFAEAQLKRRRQAS
jgi:Clp amino terminal domain, pathogenicity island component